MIKRYDGKLGHVEDGNYVSYKDYAALQQKLDALAAENAVQKENALKAEKVIMSSKFDYWSDRVELASAVKKIIETPATDTYLNSVRAASWADALIMVKSAIFTDSLDHIDFLFNGKIEQLRSGTHDTADKAG
ncbi:hypothetical protein ACTUSX_11505 [Pantoea ananatis]|uniref:hypothetical protein n=1 Tax=Pantoea ananas TaxID=553 RepID=UPI003FA47CA5